MTLNWTVANTAAYMDLRWQFLIGVEESGNPKSTPYLDSEGIPTIGVGFNLRAASVRAAVLRAFGFDIPLNATKPAAPRMNLVGLPQHNKGTIWK